MRYESFKRAVPPCADNLSGVRPGKTRVPGRYDADAASVASGLCTPEPSRAQQQFKDECDINTIAKNFGITGRLPENVRMPTFGDFTDVEDYQTALNAARWASHSFMQMPAEVRFRFENNPQKFVEFCSNSANRDEAVKLGLVTLPPVSASVPPPPEAPKPM